MKTPPWITAGMLMAVFAACTAAQADVVVASTEEIDREPVLRTAEFESGA